MIITIARYSFLLSLLVAFQFALRPARAADDVYVTEFMAENDGTVEDEDGNTPDWLELFNAGTNTVSLNGWFLTDKAGDLTKWRFPNTNLPVNAAMIVYASSKDRRTPGRPLHTSFKLDNDTGFLALVKPDGVTIQSSFTSYPQQVAGVSYGLPAVLSTTTLVSNGAPLRFTVPLSGALDPAWLAPGFDDGSWAALTNGVGFEADAPPSVGGMLLAEATVEFSGNQGGNNWFYGYWDKKTDANGTYEAADFTAFPRGTGNTLATTNYWDGTKWDYPAGNPPWTELTSTGGHPSGENGNGALPIHWTIRRYLSETNGLLRLTGTLACSGSSGTCGDGTVGHIFVDGVEVWQRAAFNFSVGYSILVNASLGSAIDFVIDPGAAANDACDATTFTAAIRTAGELGLVADSIEDWSFSGAQGGGGWFYGFYNKTTDADATYQSSNFVAFPAGTGPHSTANFWNGAAWQWFDGEPPFDFIGQTEAGPSIFPTGGTNGHEHRVVRRWVSEVTGALVVDWHVGKKNLTGGGVTATLFQNNTSRASMALTAADFTGTTLSTSLNVQAGDFLDFLVEPGADVIGDLTFFNARIHAATSLSNQFASDVGGLMTNINVSAYLRIPFTVANPASISSLVLRMKYDDGFAAWLNGAPIASVNAPETPSWNSPALAARSDAAAAQFEEFNLAAFKDFLLAGTNVLAIQGLNVTASDQDFLLRAELLAGTASVGVGLPRYFSGPTPGSPNGAGTTQLGPLITGITHLPHEPADGEDLFVTAKVSPSFNPVATVRLYYRVMFNSESNVVMLDDGLHGDGLPGDSVYGAVVPNTISSPGQMVRYYLTASDSLSVVTRQPTFLDSTNSSQYFGTVVRDPSLTNPLPVLHYFIQNLNNIDGSSTAFTKCQLYYLGEFYDNLTISRHGQSSGSFRMKSYDVDFNPGNPFRWAEGQPRVDDINLLQTYSDKSHLRSFLGYEMHGSTGVRSPTHFVVPVRVQSNAVFHGIMNIVENGDANYVKRISRDVNGSFYKIYDTLASTSTAEKKTRRWEDKSDLQALITSMGGGDTATRRTYLYDNVDISETIDFLGAMSLTHNQDCCHKNYYVYRDTEGDGEWEMMPWDVDLSFGRNWQTVENYWDDRTYSNNPVRIGANSSLPSALFGTPQIIQMYYRHYRTLMDTLVQTNGTPTNLLRLESRINALLPLHLPDNALHMAKWGTWGGGNQSIFDTSSTYWKNATVAANEIKNLYLPGRRALLFGKSTTVADAANLPDSQPTNTVININALDFSPSSGKQAEEYIRLVNPNAIYVDISGWKLTGAVTHTFQAGVVIPPAGQSNTLYVVPDKKAFRARATGPRGGQQLYIEGPYSGQLSARGETIYLVDNTGRLVATNLFVGAPSGPQQWLRITEIMYHPPASPAGSPYEAEDFEYIEFRNTGPTNINLAGVHFTNGVEFTFPAVTLAPGSNTLIVRNLAAFTSRYGTNLSVAGAYVGILDNGGESLRLDDAVGEKILDFSYDNDWYLITDGPGASLVIVDAAADWKTWDFPASWRPSAYDFGSPGVTDPPTNSWRPVLVHEVLSHSDPPLLDLIELLNPNAVAVDVSGWFMSDDFATPKKFRIPDGTVIAPGGFLSFDETQFNPVPGVPPSFALSSIGDEVYLYSGNGTNLTGWADGRSFGAAEDGVSFGLYTNSQGSVHFVAQSSTTISNHNALPKVGPVVVSEILYHPPDLPVLGDNTQDEFIEVLNITAGSVPLYDPVNPTNTWRLRSAVDFDFPTNVSLAAGATAIVVSFNPTNTALSAAFRSKFSVPVSVPLFGPWSGKLDNFTESVRLYKPDAPLAGVVPYVLVEQVDYSDAAPWPAAADGLGGSLQRIVASSYGNDATSWVGAAPTGGGAFVPGSPPVVTAPPASTAVPVGGNAMFSVSVSGTPPFAYQWQFKSNNIPGANSSVLVLNNAQMSNVGPYRVVILGAGGSAESANGILDVFVPAAFTQQPTNLFFSAPPDPRTPTNPASRVAVFRVTVTTQNPPLTYQWRMNGTNLVPGADTNITGVTSSTLTLSNVVADYAGWYSCAVTDARSIVFSGEAVLGLKPYLWVPPGAQTVANGSPVSVSAIVLAFPPPYVFQWRRSNSPIGVQTNSQPTTTPTNFMSFNAGSAGFTNTTGSFSNSYNLRLYFSNLANLILEPMTNYPSFAPGTNNIFVVADTDGDGIPNYIEAALGLATNNALDGLDDLDLDGLSNADEYRAGTEINSATNVLSISLTNVMGGAVLSFDAVSNRTYSLQFADAFSNAIPPAAWSRLADVPNWTNSRTLMIPDPAWTTNRFYRVVTPRAP